MGGHYTCAKKKNPTVNLFRLIIVLVSLRVATRCPDNNIILYLCFRAFIALQDGIKIGKIVPAKKSVTRFARATATKPFQMTSGNTTGPRKAPQTPD